MWDGKCFSAVFGLRYKTTIKIHCSTVFCSIGCTCLNTSIPIYCSLRKILLSFPISEYEHWYFQFYHSALDILLVKIFFSLFLCWIWKFRLLCVYCFANGHHDQVWYSQVNQKTFSDQKVQYTQSSILAFLSSVPFIIFAHRSRLQSNETTVLLIVFCLCLLHIVFASVLPSLFLSS